VPGPDKTPEVIVANLIEQWRENGMIAENQDIDPVQVLILFKVARGEIPMADALVRINKVGWRQFAKEAGVVDR
jgi:hypothetical protein